MLGLICHTDFVLKTNTMITVYILLAVLCIAWAWLSYDINRDPLEEEEDPTTTCWHEEERK